MVKRKLKPELLQVENFNLKIMLPLEWDGISSGKLYVRGQALRLSGWSFLTWDQHVQRS